VSAKIQARKIIKYERIKRPYYLAVCTTPAQEAINKHQAIYFEQNTQNKVHDIVKDYLTLLQFEKLMHFKTSYILLNGILISDES